MDGDANETQVSVTLLLKRIRSGDLGARERLAELIYGELRQLAAFKMRGERPGHTLSPTALVNEAWIRLRDYEEIEGRLHFLAVAAQIMRRVLIDHARAKKSAKRGRGDAVSLEGIDVAVPESNEQLLLIHEALNKLADVDRRAAQVVELRYFGGLTHTEIAKLLNIERRTVDRDWALARAWLFDQIAAK